MFCPVGLSSAVGTMMPFSTQQFLEVFASYNETLFPAQIVLLIAALIAIRLASNGDTASSKIVVGVLSFYWLWMGVVYHWIFFSRINALAFVFGGLFVLQGLLLIYSGIVRSDLYFDGQSGANRLVGTLFIVYAILIYPMLGMSTGHSYPYSPTFGLPCPTTIFTFGLLLRSGRTVPLYILPVPAIWSLLGFSAAFLLGIREDIGLLIAGVVGSVLLMSFRTRQSYQFRAALRLKEN